MKIRKGDAVLVLTGKDRGKKGTVTFAYPDEGKVIVDGVNIAKKHQKPTRATSRAASSTRTCRSRCRTSRSSARLRQADPGRLPLRARRHEGPHLPQVRGGLS